MSVTNISEVNRILFSIHPEALSFFEGIGMEPEFTSIVTGPNTAEKCSQFFELCYANRADLPEVVKEAAIDIGEFATGHGFYGLRTDGRGLAMLTAMSGGGDGPEPVGRYSPAPPVSIPPPSPPPLGGED